MVLLKSSLSLLLLSLASIACTSRIDRPGVPATFAPRVEARPCEFAAPTRTRVECGYLVVPENRGKSTSHEIKVAFALFRATGARREPTVAVFLPGGPSEPILMQAARVWEQAKPVSAHTDFLMLDYRGLGQSIPSLSCATAQLEPGPDLLSQCHEFLESSGFDLDGYSTGEIAADVAALGTALGY